MQRAAAFDDFAGLAWDDFDVQSAETIGNALAGISMPLLVKKTKARLLRMHYESGIGHIGGNLSCLEIMLSLYHRVMVEGDVFALSKGHAVGALYAVLWSKGVLTDEDLRTFHADGTRLSGHPPVIGMPEIVFATGSLGHGLGQSAGVALGKAMLGLPGRVFCLTSDGEWNEGSSWESLIFAAHHKLERLTIIVDQNGLQGFGRTRDVADLAPLADKFRTFGVTAYEIDGHDTDAIEQAVDEASRNGPAAVVARTVKGHGVSFMENRMEWHYLPMSEAQFHQALSEI
ncbi:MAG: transketolase [Bryobacteraceae bacterium]